MEQRCVIHYYYRKGKTAGQIHEKLVKVYGEDAKCLGTVYNWLLKFRCGSDSIEDDPRSRRPCQQDLEPLILGVLDEEPFATARSIARRLCVSPSAITFHLTQKMGFKLKHLHWVPHLLNLSQKFTRKDIAIEMHARLQEVAQANWSYIATGDESWFEYEYTPEARWVLVDRDPGEMENKAFVSKKTMVTIFIGAKGLLLAEVLPHGQHISGQYFLEKILEPLANMRFKDGAGGTRPPMVHFDNARVHTCQKCARFLEESGLERLPHPPYSPDLAPCDFGIFGTIKQEFRGRSFESEEELVNAIIAFFKEKPRDFFISIFENWLVRLEACIKAHGDYFTLH